MLDPDLLEDSVAEAIGENVKSTDKVSYKGGVWEYSQDGYYNIDKHKPVTVQVKESPRRSDKLDVTISFRYKKPHPYPMTKNWLDRRGRSAKKIDDILRRYTTKMNRNVRTWTRKKCSIDRGASDINNDVIVCETHRGINKTAKKPVEARIARTAKNLTESHLDSTIDKIERAYKYDAYQNASREVTDPLDELKIDIKKVNSSLKKKGIVNASDYKGIRRRGFNGKDRDGNRTRTITFWPEWSGADKYKVQVMPYKLMVDVVGSMSFGHRVMDWKVARKVDAETKKRIHNEMNYKVKAKTDNICELLDPYGWSWWNGFTVRCSKRSSLAPKASAPIEQRIVHAAGNIKPSISRAMKDLPSWVDREVKAIGSKSKTPPPPIRKKPTAAPTPSTRSRNEKEKELAIKHIKEGKLINASCSLAGDMIPTTSPKWNDKDCTLWSIELTNKSTDAHLDRELTDLTSVGMVECKTGCDLSLQYGLMNARSMWIQGSPWEEKWNSLTRKHSGVDFILDESKKCDDETFLKGRKEWKEMCKVVATRRQAEKMLDELRKQSVSKESVEAATKSAKARVNSVVGGMFRSLGKSAPVIIGITSREVDEAIGVAIDWDDDGDYDDDDECEYLESRAEDLGCPFVR